MTKKTSLTFLERIADIRRRASLKFDASNEGFKRNGRASRYITLDGVLRAIDPLLDEHGLVLIQRPEVRGGMFGIETVIRETKPEIDEDGVYGYEPKDHPNFLTGFWPCEAAGGPQKMASASTYARRYSILCCLALVAGDDDDDGNVASGVEAGTVFDRMRAARK